jgi:hypothetical protein
MAIRPVSWNQFYAYIRSRNLIDSNEMLLLIWQSYNQDCALEGVNMELALAQMIHETDFLRFSGTVQKVQNNFAGLGAVNSQTPGEFFPNIATGVRAHVQHLKAYGSTKPLQTPLVNPRFKWVKRGSAPYLSLLTGRWAADKEYATKVRKHIQKLVL